MSTLSQETLEALEKQTMQARLSELEKQFLIQKQSLDGLKDERDRALRWGILTLGGAVLAMASYIFNFIVSHLK